MRRIVLKVVGAIGLLVLSVGAGGYIYLRRSLPTIDGAITVSGVTAPVEIIRDADAIPHIFGATKRDALFGLGYVHAQDRLWQMEFQRRIGHGRLSEIFGPTPLPQDRFLRTVGFGRAARAAWAALADAAKQQVDAYVAGINAFIATHHGSALPPEFTLLRFEPEPWSGPDVLVWVKMMAWDLAANYSFELLRHDLVRAIGAERMQQLMPPYATDGLNILGGGPPSEGGPGGSPVSASVTPGAPPTMLGANGSLDSSRASAFAAFSAALSEGIPAVRDLLVGGSRTEALGSNNWVVDGTLSTTGKPLLANDPHLSTRIPSTWYLAHVVGGDTDMIGATL